MSRTAAKLRRGVKGVAVLALVVLGLPLAVTQLVLAAPADRPDFTVTPEKPVSGQPAMFTATNTKPGDGVSWDFEND